PPQARPAWSPTWGLDQRLWCDALRERASPPLAVGAGPVTPGSAAGMRQVTCDHACLTRQQHHLTLSRLAGSRWIVSVTSLDPSMLLGGRSHKRPELVKFRKRSSHGPANLS